MDGSIQLWNSAGPNYVSVLAGFCPDVVHYDRYFPFIHIII